MFLQLLIRSLVISMKYGTITESIMRKSKTHPYTFEELGGQLTQRGWVHASPDALLGELAETLVRQDTEPKFFTFHSLNNLGNETM
jgi:hypothetical protein